MELSGKNVFVTGGAGFIGSALVRDLLKEGLNVVIYDNYLSGDPSNIEEIKNDVRLIEGDIRDPKIVDNLKEHKIDCVSFKAHRLIGWDPKVDIIEGLKRTIAWYKENESMWLWERKIASEDEIWHRGL